MLSKFYNALQNRQPDWAGGLVFLLLTLLHISVSAQSAKGSGPMPKDERGKYIYYELVEKSVIPPDSLRDRALRFLGQKKLKFNKQNDGALTASGKMVINKTAFVLTHPSAEVGYNFTLEFKEDKYRFWLTDFMFIPYKRDRYSNFVPATVKGVPLETHPGKLNAGEWASYVHAVGSHAALLAEELKDYLAAVQKNKPPQVLQKSSW